MTSWPDPDERLSAYLDDELGVTERAAVDDLLARSEAWRSALAEVAWARDAVRSLPARDAPAGFWETVGDERPAVARSGRVRRVLGVAAAVAAAIAVFAVPLDTSGGGRDGSPAGSGDRTAVRGERTGVVEDDDRSAVERFVDVVLEPFGW
jgi:anti-sigma factor RsiW